MGTAQGGPQATLTFDEQGGEESLTEEDKNRLQLLEAELGAITDRTPVITDEQRAQAVAYVVIGHDGQPRVHEQHYLSTPEPAISVAEQDTNESDDTLPREEPRKPTISQRRADELALMKTELVALHVANEPAFALDLGTFIMAEAATRVAEMGAIPSGLRAPAPTQKIADFKSETHAAQQWVALDQGLDRSWVDHETLEERYDAFCSLSGDTRAGWLGWAVARTLHAVPRGGSGFLDHIGRKLQIDVAAWWRPTARTYFDGLTIASILALFEEVGGTELRQRYNSSRRGDLATSAERLFAGDVIVDAEVKAKALTWLPMEMRLEPPVSASSDEANDKEAQVESETTQEQTGASGGNIAEAA